MKILISADMEGITGVVNWNHVDPGHYEYPRFRKIMTGDINAAVTGAFDGGADEVVVTDSHANGLNILLEELDKRARLNSGLSSPFSMMQGIEAGNVDGVIFVGYHARSGSQNAVLAHTWSASRVANTWLNDILVGEFGLNAALAGHYMTPIVMVTGDQTACAQTVELIGNIETVVVKQASGFESAECLSPQVSQPMIHEAAERAMKSLQNKSFKPFTVAEPVQVTIEFLQPVHADRAMRLPEVKRIEARKVEFLASSMPVAHAGFRSAVRASSD